MRFRIWWHRWRLSAADRKETKAIWMLRRAQDAARHHRELLDQVHEPLHPWKQDFTEPMRVSGIDVPLDAFTNPEVPAADYLARLAELDSEDIVDLGDAPDAPDSPEADHLFWEETAPDMLKRLEEHDYPEP